MKQFNGKAIYNPSGKAGEYSYWACNFYVGCSNGCTYCYLKTGVLNHVMGGDKPTLKSCFKSPEHALEIFEKELLKNIDDIKKHGLFFTFTSDPMLKETIALNWEAATFAIENDVPVKFLTKSVGVWVNDLTTIHYSWKKYIAIGFTLTGHDELELGASTNAERIAAMKQLHEAGFKTFASIEPIIDFESSLKMIEQTAKFCDLYKIGLESGREYPIENIHLFLHQVGKLSLAHGNKLYFKDGFLKQAMLSRDELLHANCVHRSYNIFKSVDNEQYTETVGK